MAQEVPPASEPGQFAAGDAAAVAYSALGYIAEQVTGSSFADLVRTRITEPTGLDDTEVSDGTEPPEGLQTGVFVLGGQVYDTSMFPNTSYLTFNTANASLISTATDLVDLLDVWRAGDLFESDRTPTSDHFQAGRIGDGELPDDATLIGLDVPFNGYCPCSSTDDGMDTEAFGRGPNGVGTTLFMWAFDDGISVVLHFNSQEWTSNAPIARIVRQIHDAAVTAIG